jgi:hypothetical protein
MKRRDYAPRGAPQKNHTLFNKNVFAFAGAHGRMVRLANGAGHYEFILQKQIFTNC